MNTLREVVADALPELPEPMEQVLVAGDHDATLRIALEECYTADQMREYARAALTAALAAGKGEAGSA